MSGGNKIPKGWVETTLGSVLTKKGYIRGPFGSALKRGEMKEEGIPVYEQANAIYNHRDFRFFIDEEKHQTLKRFTVKTDDILISCSGTVGKTTIIKDADPKGIISQALLILRSDKEKINNKYLNYFLNSREGKSKIINVSHGSVQVNIAKRNDVESVAFYLPTIHEQKSIASILTTFDDKIELLQAQNQTLEATAQTIFKEWFGKYQIGDELPEGWRVGILGDVIKKINTGADAIQKAPIVDYDTGIKCLRIGDLSNNRPIDQWGYSKVTDKNFKQFQLRKYDILVTRTSILGLNKLVMEDLNAVYNNGLIRFSLIEKVNPFYIYGYFRSKYYENYISMINNDSSTRPNMKIDYLLKFPILLPPKELETKFSNIMESVLSKVSYNTQQIQTLQATRDTLLPKLMSGKVRVDEFKE